jgi:hypothetical protein
MIHSFTFTFGAKCFTGMVTSVPSYEIFSLSTNIILHLSKNYKNQFENSNFWGMWPLGHVGHVAYRFINMLFISTRNSDDKLRPQIVSVGKCLFKNDDTNKCSFVWWTQSRHDAINRSIILHLELSAWHVWLIKYKQI